MDIYENTRFFIYINVEILWMTKNETTECVIMLPRLGWTLNPYS